ncbi:Ankyrin repeat-containing domain [Phytophthora cactorum]|nr:Ankyrin repeat-containing domain [Phytophthora cactorum]
MEFAVGCPHLDVLKMVMEAGILRLDEDGAAEMNELLLLHDLDSSAGRKPPSSTQSAETSFWWSRSYSTMDLAASNGHLDVVQWLHLNRPRTCSSNAMDAAAANGYLDVVKWLHVNRSEGCTKSAMDIAASNGHLDVIQWLYVNNSVGCSTLAMLHSGHDHVSIF